MAGRLVTSMLIAIAGGSLGGQPPAAGDVRHVVSRDGTRIAYDVAGAGPALTLLHGGGQTRRAWRDAGYVSRLAAEYTVISVDLRGSGDSDKPTTKDAYAIDHMMDDLVAVADAAGARRFALWGFSYGANIGRYLASRSDRVTSMVYIGIPFGPAVDPAFRELIMTRIQTGAAPPSVAAWTGALLDYPAVEPGDMRCPTLWVVGTANTSAMQSAKAYEDRLRGTRVRLVLLDGLTHPQELERIDQTLPKAFEFTRETNSR